VRALKTDSHYIHRTSGDSRGIDLALLYKGDKFFPAEPESPNSPNTPNTSAARLIPSGTGREFLHIRGELLGEPTEIIVCHLASNLNTAKHRRQNMVALRSTLEAILGANPAANVVTMGDMNATPADPAIRKTLGPVASPWDFVYSPHAERQRQRQGTYNYRGRWYLYDWMTASPAISRGGGALTIAAAGIHARDWMTEPAPGAATRATAGAAPPTPRRTFRSGEYRAGYSDHFPVWMVVAK
jgi:hypothetical protein